MNDWTGHTTTSVELIDAGRANQMAATLDRDASFARGDRLPAGWHWLYFPEVVRRSDLGIDGHPVRGGVIPGAPLPRRMWASGTLDVVRKLRLGETATRVSTVASVQTKHGSSGPLCFVVVNHDLFVGAERVIAEQQTVVYREAPTTTPAPASQATPPNSMVPGWSTQHADMPDGHSFSVSWTLDAISLFRYSALTFNAHRIHYDADYARDVEGYPAPVVQGPLIASLLLDAAEQHVKPVSTFTFRAQAPLFVGDPITIHGQTNASTTELQAVSSHGVTTMTATASHQTGRDTGAARSDGGESS